MLNFIVTVVNSKYWLEIRIVALWAKLPSAMSTTHIRACIQITVVLLVIQFLVVVPGKAVNDVSNAWDPDTYTANSMVF